MSDPCHSSARAVSNRSGTVRHSQGKEKGRSTPENSKKHPGQGNKTRTTRAPKTPKGENPNFHNLGGTNVHRCLHEDVQKEPNASKVCVVNARTFNAS